jgi:hypothetical protein
MPLVLVPTPGADNANSYTDLAYAAAYFAGRMATGAWDAADDAARTRALVAATARLEQERYAGERASDTQALKWPRIDVFDDDGIAYASNAIPIPVQQACCEQALDLLNASGADLLGPTGLEAFSEISLGSIDITMRPAAPAGGALSPQVRRLLRGLLATALRSVPAWRAS